MNDVTEEKKKIEEITVVNCYYWLIDWGREEENWRKFAAFVGVRVWREMSRAWVLLARVSYVLIFDILKKLI